jgi:hypothetical protein
MNFLQNTVTERECINPTRPPKNIILSIQFRTTIVSSSPIFVASLHFLYLEVRPRCCLVSDLSRFTAPGDCLGVRQVESTSQCSNVPIIFLNSSTFYLAEFIRPTVVFIVAWCSCINMSAPSYSSSILCSARHSRATLKLIAARCPYIKSSLSFSNSSILVLAELSRSITT